MTKLQLVRGAGDAVNATSRHRVGIKLGNSWRFIFDLKTHRFTAARFHTRISFGQTYTLREVMRIAEGYVVGELMWNLFDARRGGFQFSGSFS
jgi:hypothetical protein